MACVPSNTPVDKERHAEYKKDKGKFVDAVGKGKDPMAGKKADK